MGLRGRSTGAGRGRGATGLLAGGLGRRRRLARLLLLRGHLRVARVALRRAGHHPHVAGVAGPGLVPGGGRVDHVALLAWLRVHGLLVVVVLRRHLAGVGVTCMSS